VGKLGHPTYVGRFRSSAMAFVKFIGTHSEYDRVDVLTISQYSLGEGSAMVPEKIAVVGCEYDDGVSARPHAASRPSTRPMASSIMAIMPQLSAIASRSSIAKAAWPAVSALPLSRCATAQATGRANARLPIWKLGGIGRRRPRHKERRIQQHSGRQGLP